MKRAKPESSMSDRSKWMQASLSDLYEFKNGVNADRQAYGRGVPFINVLEPITFSHLKGHEISGRVDLPGAAVAAYAVRQGDLVFNRTSEIGDEVGLAATYLGTECVVFGGFVIRARPVSKLIDSSFAAYALRAPDVRTQIIAMGQGAVRANIGQDNLRRVELKFPPVPEQLAIATALADADALIDSMEELLTKKRQIKQGAMQELLTGQRRIGNSANWHKLRLGDVASLKARIGWQGLTTAEYRERGDHLLVTGTEFFGGRIRWDACHYVDQDRYDQDKNIQLAPGDVLVTKDGTIGKAALIDTLPMPATLNSGVFVIRPRNQAFHPGFFYYLLTSTVFSSFLAQLSAGSTINHLYQKDFVHFRFRAPQDIDEQRAVFEVLKAIDSEIGAIDSRLAKARALKQAMAQALLTARIRLVEPTA
jgi:type I restriction enzyme, S subunit